MNVGAGVFNLVVVLLIPVGIAIALRLKAPNRPPSFAELIGSSGLRGMLSGVWHRAHWPHLPHHLHH
ncbi:MAG: hypothetical protein QOF55_1273 [Thermoleophilaceae bacterium]|jgi:hypothetical protein|nr:hypothetical protein [Thermoleophilaceae bacterium]